MQAEIAQARAIIDAASRIAVVGHVRPDGDTVGSTLALTLILEALGKRVTPVLADGVPQRFRFLPCAERVQPRPPDDLEVLITVDVSDLGRLGFAFHGASKPDLNFDHHPTNTRFASVNFVVTEAASTTEVLYNLSPQLGFPIEVDAATNLLAGLLTDTIGFRTQNVRPGSLRMAAELMEQGAPIAALYEQTLTQRSYDALRFWGRGLSRLGKEDGLVWASLTLEDRMHVGYTAPDDADLIDVLTTIQEVRVAIIFVEQGQGKVKVSWRAREGFNVASLAERFGGGGHTLAAGALLDGELDDVQRRVLPATQALLSPALENTE